MAKRILLVEDEDMIREMYQLALSQAGFEVESVADGQIAVETLSQDSNFDIILLDVMLPGLDGISVLKALRDQNLPAAQIPVFLLTNLGLEDLVKEALELGAKKYLIKSNVLPQQIIEEVNVFFQTAQ